MNIEEVRYFALSLPGVTEDQPFGDDNITFRVEGKIFMCLWLGGGKYNIDETMLRFACKLAPERNEELREQYSAIMPAFHWNKTHWSDVFFEQLDTDVVESIIRESYGVIVSKLPKSVRVKYQLCNSNL
ncbi:MmcQ/YjbR family DNA-binding protein [uncultured Prevotella sp.]|uniref:MmcQ/YjbR family DNA-binding protein n=1 Tax=uncultured Prevotella sp. TaxID=159272 RepID=UPI002637687E|nr:MmcQ/YjbR family DNA-binding protein [uncultured Prevotella sp.]MEE1385901.1 MmcQ/YjbR family DNA-binding protein [Prevotella sp.]